MASLVGNSQGVQETVLVTVGTTGGGGGGIQYGFVLGGAGTATPGTFTPNGATINVLAYYTLGSVQFSVSGSQPNGGWNQVILTNNSTLATITLMRSSATFSVSGQTTWTWYGASNVFGTTNGVTVTAVFS